MQSATWADYRATQGFEPHYLTFDDEHVAVVLLRRSTGLPGCEAVLRRGPAHAHDDAAVSGQRAAALAVWAREVGARTLYLDPERSADAEYAAAMEAAGFTATDDLEPSIHVMRRSFEADLDEEALLRSFSKSTRQRIRAAQQAGVTVEESSDRGQMEAFAGMLTHVDEQIGRVLAMLERTGQLNNTLIFVTADNGSSGEGGLAGTFNETYVLNGLQTPFDANMAHYEASKGGVMALTRAMATELGGYGITVNSVAPGLTSNENTDASPHANAYDFVVSLQALPRRGTSADIAPSVAFLASEESGWVTGQMLVADAGMVRY